jgi:hypothetical protein
MSMERVTPFDETTAERCTALSTERGKGPED